MITYSDENKEVVNKVEFHNISRESYNGKRLVVYLDDQSRVQMMKPDFDGRTVALLLKNGSLIILNVNDGTVLKTIKNAVPHKEIAPEFSFTPDSKFLLTGSEEGQVKIFDIETGLEIAKYSSHIKACLAIKFSPAFAIFASACQNIILWIPKYWDNVYN